MARLTDRIKTRIASDPLRKFKQSQEAPEWLSGAGIWVGVAALAIGAVVAVILGVTGGEATPPQASEESSSTPQQQVNPYVNPDDEEADGKTPSSGSSSGSSSDTEETDYASEDFKSVSTISLPVETSSLESKVPQGAVNVAKAGAQGKSTGDWTGIPVSRSPSDDRYLGTKVKYDSIRLADPVGDDADGQKPFTFLFDGTAEDGSEVQFSVTAKYADDGYQVVIF